MEREPVEDCVQNTLSALYPPFAATAPTLLGQVFEVLERTYRDDALRYTIEFLIPAKHILARIQQEACAQYSGFVFCHEGWPLSLHEKVVVQLSSLPWQELRPGDFYLQVAPYLARAPRLVLRCLSPDGHRVQELPVPPEAYPFLFTAEWLNSVNAERRAGRLQQCLVVAEAQVLRLPWTELICPQFVHQDGFLVGRRCLPGPGPLPLGARSPGDGRHSSGESQEPEGGALEGEYVQLLEISPPRPPRPPAPAAPTSQSRTLPARKGQSKGRSQRHRAWLHPKPSREETLPRNRPRRTWEGGRPGGGQAGLLQAWDRHEPHGETRGPRASQGDGQEQGGVTQKAAAPQSGCREAHLPGQGGRGGAPSPGEGQQGRDPGGQGGHPSPGEGQGGDPGGQGGGPSLREGQEEDLGGQEGQQDGDPGKGPWGGDPGEQRGGLRLGELQGGDPGEQRGGLSLRELQGRDPGSPAAPPQPSLGAKGLHIERGQAGWLSEWPGPGQREESQGPARPSSPWHKVPGPELRSLGPRTHPPGGFALGLPHRTAKGTRRRRRWGARGCRSPGDWEEPSPGSPGPGMGAAPAGTKEGGSPSGTGPPITSTSGEGDIPPSRVEGAVPPGTGVSVPPTPGEGDVPPSCAEGGVPPGTGVSVPPTPGEGDVPPSCAEGGVPPGTGVPLPPTPGEGDVPPSCTEGGVPPGTGVPLPPTPGEGDVPPSCAEGGVLPGTGVPGPPAPGEGNIPPSCAEGGSPSGTRLPGPPSPKEAAAAGCSGQVALPVARAEAAGSPGSLERMEAVGAGSTPFVRSAEPPREGAGAGCPLEALPPTPGPHGLDVDWELLRSGIFQLTGGVDRTGRALLTVNPQLMGKPAPGQEELSQALWYLHSLLRKEQRELGLTVLLDLRQRGTQPPFPPALPAALQELQEASPAPVSRLLVLGPPEGPAELPLAQEAPALSLADLPRFVDSEQLQPALGGTLQHSHHQWVEMCQALERLCVLCHGVIRSVQGTRVELEASGPAESEAVLTLHIAGHQEAMQKLLSDPRLLELQSSGGALLARLPPSGAHSAQAARAAALYQEVDDAIHRLVQFSNQRLEQLQQERSHRQLEQAQAGAQERVGCLSATEDSAEPEAGLGAQDQCCQQHSESSNSTLQETPGLVAQSSRALWDLGWYQARCQELGRFLQRRLEVALRAGPPPRRRADSTSASSSPQHPGRGRGLGTGLASSRSMSCVLPAPGSPSPGLCRAPLRLPVEHSDEEQSPSAAAFFQAPTLPLATSTPGRPPPKGPPSTQRALSIPVPSPPQPSVLIRGLEVSSQEVVDQTCSPREHVMVVRSGAQRAEAPWGGTPSTDRKRRLGAQQQLVAQLLALEQDYVGYLAESLPLEPGCQGLSPGLRRECQALESTRQQLLDFHRAYLLQGLQSCASHPLRVGACFLRYVEQFGLYAHYVKSQQKLAAALGCQSAASKTAHGSLEAPQEDVALGSALRRPLEQLERYGHFLGELLQETDPEQASERDALGEAQRMLDSQVQHGTNLLAMEQIRGCELDLAAQGQLLQRDELAVLQGRRKRHRHVFLFERLLLFCKRKGAGGGLDLYLCKQAFPTADMGLTENIGESGLCFELWFRHPKLRQAYTLQAPSPNVKHQWTSAVAQLLWSQATLSKVPKTMTGTGPAGAQGASSSGGAESPGGSAPGQRQPSWGWSLHRKLFASQNRTV